MLFRRIVLCALLVGALAGGLLTAVMQWQVSPIIAAAEVFERAAEAPATLSHAHAGGASHVHADGGADTAVWQPADGKERLLWTLAANIASGVGFSLVLLPLMALWDARHAVPRVNAVRGLCCGLAGYVSFFVVPALGIVPEIPGAEANGLAGRQGWWLLAAGCAASAFAVPAFLRHRWRWLALGLLALPFIVGAPPRVGDSFAGFPPEIAADMRRLATDFIAASALAMAAYWLALGAAGGFAVRRWLRAAFLTTLQGNASNDVRRAEPPRN